MTHRKIIKILSSRPSVNPHTQQSSDSFILLTAVGRAARARSGHLVAVAIHTPALAAAAVTLVGPVVALLITGGQILTCRAKETDARNTSGHSVCARA